MSQKLPVNGFKWVKRLLKFNERFIKKYDENSNKGYFLEVDVKYPKNLFNLHKDFAFLPEWQKIKKCEKLVCNIKDKEKYVVPIRNKSFTTRIKSRINTKKGTQSNSIQSKSMVKKNLTFIWILN